MKDKQIVMYDDPSLVTYRTDLEGWTGADNLYHGLGMLENKEQDMPTVPISVVGVGV